jgi:hypothetical protein
MGLDNMPHEYPCKRQGTAVIDKVVRTWEDDEGNAHSEDTYPIDCDKTIEAGGCPFTNADPPKEGRILGMLGTYCWYRGKSGNGLVRALNGGGVDDVWDTGDDNFYGTDDEGLYRSPADCVALADDMAAKLEAMGGKLLAKDHTGEKNDYTSEALYAIWYLRWVAKDCDGMDAWY